VDVVAHVVKAEGVGRIAGYGFGTGEPAGGIIRPRFRGSVSPGEKFLFEVAASGALPLGFGGDMVGATGLRGEPVAIMIGVEPGNSGDGLEGMAEIGIAREGRGFGGGGVDEAFVFGVGDLRSCKEEGIDKNTVDGAFAILAGVGSIPTRRAISISRVPARALRN
jgi:hypothetical protein